MDWLLLALLSALALASADALTKKWLADYSAREIALVRFGLPALLLAPLLWLNPLPSVPLAFWAWVMALVPLEVMAMLLYMRAIRDSPLALTLPYLALTPVLTTLTGLLVLGEQVSVQGLAGILLVVLGTYLLNLEHAWEHPRENTREDARQHAHGTNWRMVFAPFRAILRERGSRLMMVVAVIYSLTSVMGKAALQYVPPQTFGAFYFVLLGLLTLAVFSVRQPRIIRVVWRRPGAHLAIGLLLGVMTIAHFLAIARVEVAYMIAVKRTSLLFGIVYGALLFGEERLGQHLLAGAFMVAGVALIAL
jgi:drug/metabolite transporter (DMT)-like permease